ncbi:hypothetical protein D3C87_1939210 [compost metagenome]
MHLSPTRLLLKVAIYRNEAMTVKITMLSIPGVQMICIENEKYTLAAHNNSG